MSFCPICKTTHDSNWPCTDRTGEVLRDACIEPKLMSGKELKETIKKADRSMMLVLIVVLAMILLTVFLGKIISKLK